MKFSNFQLTRLLFFLNIAILSVFGIGSLLRINGKPDQIVLYIFYVLVMFGDALLMGFCAWQLPERTKFIFYFSVFVLSVNIIPTVFDQFGLPDLLFVLLNIATLIFLVMARKDFLSA